MQTRKIFTACFLIIVFSWGSQSVWGNPYENNFFSGQPVYAKQFIRTELYFGTDKNDGTQVTSDEWNKFLADEVTPRFPDGFTVLQGFGQFRGSDGKIVREESKVLILLYPLKNRRSVNIKIEQIRTNYKKAFQQESVLRMDFQQAVRVSF